MPCQPTYAWEVTETFAAEQMLGLERFCVILVAFCFCWGRKSLVICHWGVTWADPWSS